MKTAIIIGYGGMGKRYHLALKQCNIKVLQIYDSKINEKFVDKVPVFKDLKNGKLKVISFFAKKARGAFARFVIKNQPQTIDDLTLFNDLGYVFSQKDSSNNIIFTR